MSPRRELTERFYRLSDGRVGVALPGEERTLLAALPRELLVALGELEVGAAVPAALGRLFPAAFPRDALESERFADLERRELEAAHVEALELLVEFADATVLTERQLDGWLRAVGDLRLILGTNLDVSEETTAPDPQAPMFAEWLCYHYLSALQSEIVEVLYGALPPPIPGADDSAPDDPWGEPLGDLRWDGTERPGV